jgi:hypothetical protein
MTEEKTTWCGWFSSEAMLGCMISEARGIKLPEEYMEFECDRSSFGIEDTRFDKMYAVVEDKVWINIWFRRITGEVVDAGRRTRLVFHAAIEVFNLSRGRDVNGKDREDA